MLWCDSVSYQIWKHEMHFTSYQHQLLWSLIFICQTKSPVIAQTGFELVYFKYSKSFILNIYKCWWLSMKASTFDKTDSIVDIYCWYFNNILNFGSNTPIVFTPLTTCSHTNSGGLFTTSFKRFWQEQTKISIKQSHTNPCTVKITIIWKKSVHYICSFQPIKNNLSN